MKNRVLKISMMALALHSAGAVSNEEQRKDLLRVQKTTFKLIDILVEEGKLSPQKAEALKQQAEQEALQQLQREMELEPIDPDSVRVNYVPEFVQDNIAQKIREEMMQFVLADVREQAKQERWGVPGTWPEWIDKIKISGDVRFRAEMQGFDNANSSSPLGGYTYVNVNAINADRRFNQSDADRREKYFLNVSDDIENFQVRARLNITANVSDNWSAGMRLRAGSRNKPISCCERLGQEGKRLETIMDIAYLAYDSNKRNGLPIISIQAGRFYNPFEHTSLVWDSDYTFEGLASTLNYSFDNNKEGAGSSAFMMLGAFPIGDYNQRGQQDKWLNALQLGFDLGVHDKLHMKTSIAYYNYINIEGVANPADRKINDYTAPAYVTKGNTLFNIDGTSLFGDEVSSVDDALFALASDYNLMNILLEWEWTYFNPIDVTFFYDYVKNIAWDTDETQSRVNTSLNQSGFKVLTIGNTLDERNTGYHYGVVVGHAKLNRVKDWQLSLAYKYLEADAVLDAYTDSSFHGGGTDAKGMVLVGAYGLGAKSSIKLEYINADEIDGIPLNTDAWKLDWTLNF